jgi:WD40 repeat protein
MRNASSILILVCLVAFVSDAAQGAELRPLVSLNGWDVRTLATVPGTDLCLLAIRGQKHKSGEQDPDRLLCVDLSSGRILRDEKFAHGSLTTAAVTPDGKLCVHLHHDGKIIFRDMVSWQVAATAVLKEVEAKNANDPRRAVFNRDGSLLIVACNNRLVGFSAAGKIAYDVALPQDATRLESYIWDLAASPSAVACARNDGRITLHSPSDGKLLATYKDPHYQEALAIAFSPDGSEIALGGAPCAARVYDAKTGKLLRAMPKQEDHVVSVCFSPSGELLAVAVMFYSKVRVFAMRDGRQLFDTDIGVYRSCTCFKTENRLIVASGNGLYVIPLPAGTRH